jgi:hypothetical protein
MTSGKLRKNYRNGEFQFRRYLLDFLEGCLKDAFSPKLHRHAATPRCSDAGSKPGCVGH